MDLQLYKAKINNVKPILVSNNDYTYKSFIIFKEKEGLDFIYNFIDNNYEISLDIETTGLDCRTTNILLLAIGNENNLILIDVTTINIKNIIKRLKNKLLIGHNIKFDISTIFSFTWESLKNLYDTMITEQRIYQGFGISSNNPNGISFALGCKQDKDDGLLFRYCRIDGKEQDKSIRKDFINMQNKIFSENQLLYAINDIKYLPYIKTIQSVLIDKYNLNTIVNIENKLIYYLAKCELEGFRFDENKWLKVYHKNKENLFLTQLELDNEFQNLKKNAPKKHQIYLNNPKYNRTRNSNTITKLSLFEEIPNEVIPISNKKNYINYSSPKELITLFSYLNLELPTKEDEYKVPININGIVHNDNFTTDKKALELYSIERLDSKAINFISLLIKYRELSTRINNFGDNWVKKHLKPNNRVYTTYRQCTAINGRFQSGGSKNGEDDKYNSQNIPADNNYRECFIADENYQILTLDLSGAEVTIMADKANDNLLYELAVKKDDVHSPVIQNCWRNIYLYRSGKAISLWDNPREFKFNKNKENFTKYLKTTDNQKSIKNYETSKDFIVSKSINKNLRKSGKNLTFGSIYGCKAKKAAKTININIEEGQVYLDSIKEMLPKTFNYVEKNVQLALRNGYLIIDNYSNSRIWFPSVITSKRNDEELEFYHLQEVDGQARNIPISGTQANMIKLAIIEIGEYLEEHNIEAQLLLQVHDELVYRIPKDLVYCEFIIFNNEHFYFKGDETNIVIYNEIEFEYFKFTYNTENDCIFIIDLPTFIKLQLCRSANKFLNNFKMKADMTIANNWKK